MLAKRLPYLRPKRLKSVIRRMLVIDGREEPELALANLLWLAGRAEVPKIVETWYMVSCIVMRQSID